jgi:hypothetical protein
MENKILTNADKEKPKAHLSDYINGGITIYFVSFSLIFG